MSPSTDRKPLHQTMGARIAVALFLFLTLAYALLIAQQILLWVVLAVTTVVLWYTARLVVALEQIATALSRLADTQTDAHFELEE
ncbi:hypothetical protein GJR96_00160 [Haloferax sp. MBLA0076]|uniref:Uncharacterized protein n=1 Tax=Haloferax litoreum TaxID=2666140 RepID=A0A6A8GCV4_9EURY|nr:MULTISPECIES: hypothetical protein [Haloferax]KAB1191934.1 hypothetical protein Hfx1148_00160 [Haloferax sp. CBA1148]MRX20372.1 hypothetical protein [Haloferax litoreum]